MQLWLIIFLSALIIGFSIGLEVSLNFTDEAGAGRCETGAIRMERIRCDKVRWRRGQALKQVLIADIKHCDPPSLWRVYKVMSKSFVKSSHLS
jgi:hypothetical protein